MNSFLVKEYIWYWLNCVNQHSLHSPFVYDLYTQIIKSQNVEPELFSVFDILRKELAQDKRIIHTQSFGANSTINSNLNRTVQNIAGSGITDSKYSRLFYRIGKYLQPDSIFEFGTSLGLNSLYLASIPGAKLTTFEGCSETLSIAREIFEKADLNNISIIEGNLDQTLDHQLQRTEKLDMVFFDANHRYEPTMRYFRLCEKKMHKRSLFIFDDIHWSLEMKKAWMEIINDPLVSISIDLFQVGLVFFDHELPKQHFVLDF